MTKKLTIIVAAALAFAFSLPAFAGPAAAQAPATSAVATSATDDVEIQVKRMWFPFLSQCMTVGAAGVVADAWDRWFCSPQLLGGWRLYTNR